jgi:hypothetical protein
MSLRSSLKRKKINKFQRLHFGKMGFANPTRYRVAFPLFYLTGDPLPAKRVGELNPSHCSGCARHDESTRAIPPLLLQRCSDVSNCRGCH